MFLRLECIPNFHCSTKPTSRTVLAWRMLSSLSLPKLDAKQALPPVSVHSSAVISAAVLRASLTSRSCPDLASTCKSIMMLWCAFLIVRQRSISLSRGNANVSVKVFPRVMLNPNQFGSSVLFCFIGHFLALKQRCI